MSVEVIDLTYIYDRGLPYESTALDGVSFRAEDGDIIGIIGHTGSGKSTLVQHLNGLISPSSGRVIVDGRDIAEEKKQMYLVRRKVGLVFQYPEYQLFEDTVAKDIAFGPRNTGVPEEEIEERVRRSMELMGMDYERYKGRSPFDLSGGQKRRIAIAGVIAMEPSTLILDEPTAGLDPLAKAQILDAVKDIHDSLGSTVIMISHNMTDIAVMCDRVIVMDRGKILMEGAPGEVFGRREELETVGLKLPPALELICDLRDRGFDIRKDPFTAEEAAEAIFEVLAG